MFVDSKENQQIEKLKNALNKLLSKKKSIFKGVILSDPGDEQQFYHIIKKSDYENKNL